MTAYESKNSHKNDPAHYAINNRVFWAKRTLWCRLPSCVDGPRLAFSGQSEIEPNLAIKLYHDLGCGSKRVGKLRTCTLSFFFALPKPLKIVVVTKLHAFPDYPLYFVMRLLLLIRRQHMISCCLANAVYHCL